MKDESNYHLGNRIRQERTTMAMGGCRLSCVHVRWFLGG